MKAVHFWVSGLVQGVFFRASTQRRAMELGVDGWVRNLRDRRVEGFAEGDDDAVDALVAWLHDGPPHAIVSDVEVEEADPEGHPRFEVRR